MAKGVVFLFLCLSLAPATAIDNLHIELGQVQSSSWSAENVVIDLGGDTPAQPSLHFSAARVTVPAPLDRLSNVSLDCPSAVIEGDLVSCENGQLRLDSTLLKNLDSKIDVSYQQTTGALALSIKDTQLADGSLAIKGNLDDDDWRLQLMANGMAFSKLPAALAGVMEWPQGYKARGRLSILADASGRTGQFEKLNLSANLRDVNFSAADGSQASEKLDMDIRLNAAAQPAGWQFDAEIKGRQGQLYLEPVFLEFADKPVTLAMNGVWQQKQERVSITQFRLDHPDVARAQGKLEWALNPARLKSASLAVAETALAPFFKTYLQPLLIDTAFDGLDTEGRISAELEYRDAAIASIAIKMQDAILENPEGRFGIAGLRGTLGWTRGKAPVQSDLSWNSAHVYKITLGASRMKLQSSSSDLTLLGGMSLPLLDGALQIDNLKVTQLATPEVSVQLTGELAPISMSAFSQALDWPVMSGKLSSTIPSLRYANGKLEVDGELRMRVFEGDLVFSDLQMEEPFGAAPVLSADVNIVNLDLEALTSTYSFGKIEGKLGGTISDLRMVDWQPVAFDARLATPENDESKHRISQKAVDSLSSLGGGVSGALSRSFLRFFDEFSYARLGVNCRLQDGVCEMSGVEPAENGYYIVKGGGLPRIDVKGFSTQVDWDTLVERLKNATQSDGPIIQ